MARQVKDPLNLQVFRGSKPRADVFTANAGVGCCDDTTVNYDKLGQRVRFDNALAHLNPSGANDKWQFRHGTNVDSQAIVDHLTDHGIGASVSVLAIPTFAFVKGVGIKILAAESGVTFALRTRNGLDLGTVAVGDGDATAEVIVVDTGFDGACSSTHALSSVDLEGFGQLPNDVAVRDIFILPTGTARGAFSLEADEIILELASAPTGGIINGTFQIEVSVSYDIINRAEH